VERLESERWPCYEADEIEAAAACLASGRVNQWTGDRVKTFETAFAARWGMPHAVAVFNGTVAIDLALKVLGIGPGDEVIVTPRSFMASASAVAMAGAVPVFADVEPGSGNISAATVAPHVTARTRAILPVHLGGWPVDMPPLMELARRHGLAVIEDCAQSHGATIDGRPTGSFGDIACFSFCQDKIMTTGGEGGMVLLKDEALYRRAWSYKDHGKDFELMRTPNPAPGFRYVHTSIGTNWRMIEMQAAIGLRQLEKLDRWIAARRRRSAIWTEAFAHLHSLETPSPPSRLGHACYKHYAYLLPDRMRRGHGRDAVLRALQAAGVRAFSGSCTEIYRERAFAHLDVARRPVAHDLGERSLMLEVHPTLDEARLKRTAALAAEVIASFESA
jgi:dTDP-4-amino-4,6-dideoxygalactose transaminase